MGLAVIFSGQGDQYPKMLAKFAPELEANGIQQIANSLAISLVPEINLSVEQLFSNRYAQPLIAGYEYLVWNYLKNYLPVPLAFAGYSLGEITAISCAANFSLSEILSITNQRAKLMLKDENAINSSLIAISGVNINTLMPIYQATNCYLAIKNSPQNLIIGGKTKDLVACTQLITNIAGQVKITKLNVEVASHTPLLNNASKLFAQYLQNYPNFPLKVKLVSSINAQVQYTLVNALIDCAKQISQTINFDQAIRVLFELGANILLEIGPGTALTNIVKQQNLPIQVKSINDFATLLDVVRWIKLHLA